MGYRPPVPWSMPDQDEPETWASWERRHRPKVLLPDEVPPSQGEPNRAAFTILVILCLAVFYLAARSFGVL